MTILTKIIGDEGKKSLRYNPNLADQVNQEVEAESKRKELEARLKISEPAQKYQNPESISKRPIIGGFIYVPSIGVYLAKEKILPNHNWYDAHRELAKNGTFMPTIKQFTEFLLYLMNNTNGINDASSSEITNVLDEILSIRNPSRAEWLDARFKRKEDGFYLLSEHRIKEDKFQPKYEQPLEDMARNSPYVRLMFNSQGLPVEKSGINFYASMRNIGFRDQMEDDSVAGVSTDDYDASLDCDWNASNPSPEFGVRPAFILNESTEQKIESGEELFGKKRLIEY